VHALHAAGQDLVRIGLVAHIPDDAVVRRIEDVVQRDGEFHHAEARAEVPAAGLPVLTLSVLIALPESTASRRGVAGRAVGISSNIGKV
jgi:hypothetical protein